jgi:two-component system phosphate regulon response regulator PhoB
MSRRKILVIEDEPDIRELLIHHLHREGHRVLSAGDGFSGLEQARKENPDVILLDLMLPGMDGLEVCRRLKADPMTRDVSVVMLTAKTEESDIVLGLGLGADDYVPKPFRIRELLARLDAVLRRGAVQAEEAASDAIVRGNILIDPSRHQVHVNDVDVLFTATEFRLLAFLAQHAGRVFTRDQLVNRVLGHLAIVTPRNIDVHVRSLRAKLGDEREVIETVRGVGYRFRAD